MPKRPFAEDVPAPDPSKKLRSLDPVLSNRASVLFVPFEAVGPHYERNSKNGVRAFANDVDQKGKSHLVVASERTVVPPSTLVVAKGDLSGQLNKIVEQECELIRRSQGAEGRLSKEYLRGVRSGLMSESQLQQVNKRVGSFDHYPSLVFLSENPTKEDFPDRLVPNALVTYVKKFELDRKEVKPVNQMAVYLRDDIDKAKGYSVVAEAVTRAKGDPSLFKPTKEEHMLKVTFGAPDGTSFTVAGVHLRATLTGSSVDAQRTECAALERFSADHGIQLMVGDFNMDVQAAAGSAGGRGVLLDSKPENRPVYLMKNEVNAETKMLTSVAYPRYLQQYSSSNNEKHYMGYLQTDKENLRLVGTGEYGQMGASGSRSLQASSEFYSDHPSIYVSVMWPGEDSAFMASMRAQEGWPEAMREGRQRAERKMLTWPESCLSTQPSSRDDGAAEAALLSGTHSASGSDDDVDEERQHSNSDRNDSGDSESEEASEVAEHSEASEVEDIVAA